MGGTSVAAAHVSGMAALILQARPGINPASVKDLIIRTATPMTGYPEDPYHLGLGWNKACGWGLVNAYAALAESSESGADRTDVTFWGDPPVDPSYSPAIVTSPRYLSPGERTTVTARIVNRGPNSAPKIRIHFGVGEASLSPSAFQDLGTRIVDLPVHAEGEGTEVSVGWTPQTYEPVRLYVEIG